MLKKLSIASAGAALVTLGIGSLAPAQSASLTTVSFTGGITVSAGSFSRYVPLNNISVEVDDLENRVNDGSLTLNARFDYLIDYLNTQFSPATVSLTSFLGFGTVSKNGTSLSNFDFSYDAGTDVLTVDNYDVGAVSNCLVGTCSLLGQGSFSGNISLLSSSKPFQAQFSFDIAQTATPIGEPGINITSVPEPTAIAGLAGIGALLATRRSKKQIKQAA